MTPGERARGAAAATVGLHRLLAAWGEGTSSANLGRGAPSTPGDATWIHTFFDGEFWGTPGGDYDPLPSALALVEQEGDVVWGPSDPLARDVQGWVDAPLTDHGWLIRGDEERPSSVKVFDTREAPDEATRPLLAVQVTLPHGRQTRGSGSEDSCQGSPACGEQAFLGAIRRAREDAAAASPAGETATY